MGRWLGGKAGRREGVKVERRGEKEGGGGEVTKPRTQRNEKPGRKIAREARNRGLISATVILLSVG